MWKVTKYILSSLCISENTSDGRPRSIPTFNGLRFFTFPSGGIFPVAKATDGFEFRQEKGGKFHQRT